MSIQAIEVKNFRLLKNIKVDFKKVNLIWGQNASGKTTLTEAIYFLKQNMNNQIRFPMLGDNIFNISFGDFEDIISFKNTQNIITISLTISITNEFRSYFSDIIHSFNDKSNINNIEHYRLPFRGNNITYTLEFFNKERLYSKVGYYVDSQFLIGIEETENRITFSPKDILRNDNDIRLNNVVFNPFSDLSFIQHGSYPELESILATLINCINDEFKKVLKKYYLIKTNRSLIPIYQEVKNMPEWIGLEGNYLIEFLSRIWGNRKYDEIRSSISRWANEFGLSDLNAGWYNANLLHANFKDNITNDVYNLSFAGTGSRQLIPLITQLFVSEEGSTIVIEEPEISLGLEWQNKLIEMIYEASGKNKQIIMTTHSPDLIPILENYLKRNKKWIKDTNILQMEYNSVDGSKIEKINISEKGKIQLPKYIKSAQDKIMDNYFDNIKLEDE